MAGPLSAGVSGHVTSEVKPRVACIIANVASSSANCGAIPAAGLRSARGAAIWFVLTACGAFLLRAHMPLGVACTVAFMTVIRLFSAQALAYSASSTVYVPPLCFRGPAKGPLASGPGMAVSPCRAPRQAAGSARVTGIGRTGAVGGPWLGGAVIEGGNAGLGFTAFAVTTGVGICLVPMARRTQRGPATQQASALSGAID